MLAALAIGLVALLLRLLDLGRFLTHDEAEFWIDRAQWFGQALQAGDPAATAISTHPGVTTMWLGAAGLWLREWLFAQGVLHTDSFLLLLIWVRLPVVLVHTAGVVVGFWLLWKLLPRPAAVLAGVFWAADPFIIAYSRLLHVDALLMTFATLSLLALCVYSFRTPHTGYLLLSGVCAALAVLSKSPGLALLPIAGLVLLLRRPFSPLHSAFSIILWGGAFGLTLVLVWPAVWADPGGVYHLLRVGVEVEGAQPHMTGNFFLGQRTAAPGLLFYPVALVLRLTPITLVGVLLLPVGWRRLDERTRRSLLVLLAFVLLFTLAMSLFPKKFNRYLVPVFPALDILAAVGLASLMHHASFIAHRFSRIAQRFPFSLLPSPFSLLILLAVLNAAHWHPYPIAAFNQALGGSQAGARLLAVGWGEGYEQVADWLNQQPDAADVLTISRMIKSLNPYLDEGVQAFFPSEGELRANAGYLVVSISEVQGGPPLPPSDAFYGQATPLHTVTIHGVPYAWVYDVPPDVAHPRRAQFGAHIRLHGFDSTLPLDEPARLQPGATLRLRLVWSTDAALPVDYWLFAHLVDAGGQRVAQVDIPYPTSTWQPGRFTPAELPLMLPPAFAADERGPYRLLVGLYNPATGQRLPLRSGQPAAPALSGPDALRLTALPAR